jgi:hypothetical protein
MLLIGFDENFSIFREIVNFYSVPKVASVIVVLPKGPKCCHKTSLGRL